MGSVLKSDLGLVGKTVSRIAFGKPYGIQIVIGECTLRVHDKIAMNWNGRQQVLEGSLPGRTYNPEMCATLVRLLDTEIEAAKVEQDGLLEIRFSGNVTLSIRSTTGYEAWELETEILCAIGGGTKVTFFGK